MESEMNRMSWALAIAALLLLGMPPLLLLVIASCIGCVHRPKPA
jgi:hypothetical protein